MTQYPNRSYQLCKSLFAIMIAISKNMNFIDETIKASLVIKSNCAINKSAD